MDNPKESNRIPKNPANPEKSWKIPKNPEKSSSNWDFWQLSYFVVAKLATGTVLFIDCIQFATFSSWMKEREKLPAGSRRRPVNPASLSRGCCRIQWQIWSGIVTFNFSRCIKCADWFPNPPGSNCSNLRNLSAARPELDIQFRPAAAEAAALMSAIYQFTNSNYTALSRGKS